MKVRTRILMGGLAVFVLTLSLIFFACKKNAENVSDQPAKTVTTDKQPMLVTRDNANPNARVTPCEGTDITYMVWEWNLATCRTNCTRGIGFRCGHRFIYGCKNAPPETSTYMGSCPNGASSYSRIMKADVSFYSDGYLKLTFNNAVPESDAGNVNFEIEGNDLFNFPEGMLFDGRSYAGFKTIAGTYKIDYADGIYGSVIIPIQLISKR